MGTSILGGKISISIVFDIRLSYLIACILNFPESVWENRESKLGKNCPQEVFGHASNNIECFMHYCIGSKVVAFFLLLCLNIQIVLCITFMMFSLSNSKC